MYYMNRSKNRKNVYQLNPIWDRLLEPHGRNHGIYKNAIVFDETDDITKHCVKVPEDERYVHYQEVRYPKLDKLAEENF
jgi:hypothetical protein